MVTIGVDFHKRTSTYSVLNEQGQKVMNKKVVNSADNIRGFISSFPEPKTIAMESTRSWPLFYETVKDLTSDFRLGHSLKIKAIAYSEIKHDRIDADILAKLAHNNFFPQVFVPGVSIRDLRSVTRLRHFLANQRRSIRNQVQAVIDNNVWPADRPGSFKNIFCKRGRAWLAALPLPERPRFIINECLKNFDALSAQISDIEYFLQQQEFDIPGLRYLRSTPGFQFSRVNAYIVLVEIGDIQRFRKANGLLHYAGLIPREYSSGDNRHMGRLIKQANMHLRTALIESTLAAIRADKGLKAYYKSVKAHSGSGPAIIATARKLCKAVFYVLKEQRLYKPEEMFHPPVAACHSSLA